MKQVACLFVLLGAAFADEGTASTGDRDKRHDFDAPDGMILVPAQFAHEPEEILPPETPIIASANAHPVAVAAAGAKPGSAQVDLRQYYRPYWGGRPGGYGYGYGNGYGYGRPWGYGYGYGRPWGYRPMGFYGGIMG